MMAMEVMELVVEVMNLVVEAEMMELLLLAVVMV